MKNEERVHRPEKNGGDMRQSLLLAKEEKEGSKNRGRESLGEEEKEVSYGSRWRRGTRLDKLHRVRRKWHRLGSNHRLDQGEGSGSRVTMKASM